jgi:hypothetical protein
MRQALNDLDRILRGDASHLDALESGSLSTPSRRLSGIILLLGMFYGICMGCFSVISGQKHGWMQIPSSMLKVPALFFLTLIVTLPSLYVFNALVGSRLTFISFLRLLVAAMGVMLALLASFGTIVAFFSFTSTSLSFMILLNVAVFAVSGVIGLTFLMRTLQRLSADRRPRRTVEPLPEPAPASESSAEPVPFATPAEPTGEPSAAESAGTGVGDASLQDRLDSIAAATNAKEAAAAPPRRLPGPLDRLPDQLLTGNVQTIFRIWILLFGLVGAQMSWILRPFIGSGHEFALFRPRGSNFFEAVFHHLTNLF